MTKLMVWREIRGTYELVGSIEGDRSSSRFAYDPGYLSSADGAAVSLGLPLQADPFSNSATKSFFSGLIPEGSLRRDMEMTAHAERGDYLAVLDLVRNEPVGALLFTEEGASSAACGEGAYEPLALDRLDKLATSPAQEVLDMTLRSRISLAGAQSKVGLYHHGEDPSRGWYLPHGAVPSTHIVKACSDAYPEETVCEALCLRAAEKMDLPVASCFLIETSSRNPLLAVARYDRVMSEDGPSVQGLQVPRRLHQEDMCQALSLSPGLKYEPTDSNYLNLIASSVRRASSVASEDRYLVGYYQLFDYAVGNCDNHLKNWSFVWNSEWSEIRLAPLYDVVSTLLYPNIIQEMGVSFGGSRRIGDATREMVTSRLRTAGIAPVVAHAMFVDMAQDLPDALASAADGLADEGFSEARDICDKTMPGVRERLALLKG